MKTTIPSIKDISPTGCIDLDERKAVKVFHGKDRQSAMALFSENPAHYVDCLHSMGPIAFRYYFLAYLDYLYSPDAMSEPGGLHSLVCVLDIRNIHVGDMKTSFDGIEQEVFNALDWINRNMGKFDLDERIYGNVTKRLNIWRSYFRNLTQCDSLGSLKGMDKM